MAITDLPLFSMLRTRMQWHQERQRLLSENVANSDTPNYRPRDLAPLQFDRATPALASIGLQRTEVCHIASSEATSRSAGRDRAAAAVLVLAAIAGNMIQHRLVWSADSLKPKLSQDFAAGRTQAAVLQARRSPISPRAWSSSR